MSDTYSPRPGSPGARICAHFKANPAARIVESELCARFGATKAQLGAAEDADLLASELVGRSNVYSAGPRLASWQPSVADAKLESATNPSPAPAPTPSLPAASVFPRRAEPVKRIGCEPADLVLEDNVPMPKAFGPNGGGGRFDAIFAKMKVGQSFKRPHEEAKALKDSADRWSKKATGGKARFATRRIDETMSRVWRTE